jgi:hypothetical protein
LGGYGEGEKKSEERKLSSNVAKNKQTNKFKLMQNEICTSYFRLSCDCELKKRSEVFQVKFVVG